MTISLGQLPGMKVSRGFTKSDLKSVYELYFEQLRGFLYYKTGNIELSEDLVQEVFVKLWDNRDNIKTETVKSLLFTMANNLMINHFNHQKVVTKHEQATARSSSEEFLSPQFRLEEKEFEVKFNNAINALPEGCREVFLMNRIDKLKYDEIATRLDLSVKAIEKRMSKAIGILKDHLGMKI